MAEIVFEYPDDMTKFQEIIYLMKKKLISVLKKLNLNEVKVETRLKHNDIDLEITDDDTPRCKIEVKSPYLKT
jgi:DNA-binding sugar fermentation-stimulating protein